RPVVRFLRSSRCHHRPPAHADGEPFRGHGYSSVRWPGGPSGARLKIYCLRAAFIASIVRAPEPRRSHRAARRAQGVPRGDASGASRSCEHFTVLGGTYLVRRSVRPERARRGVSPRARQPRGPRPGTTRAFSLLDRLAAVSVSEADLVAATRRLRQHPLDHGAWLEVAALLAALGHADDAESAFATIGEGARVG